MDRSKHEHADHLLESINEIEKDLEILSGFYSPHRIKIRLFKNTLLLNCLCESVDCLNRSEFQEIVEIMINNRKNKLKELKEKYKNL